MKILLGTHYLAKIGGTESYTYALALKLKRLGHEVEYYANVKGGVSSLLEENGVPFMSADHYDLILANHNTVVEKLWTKGYLVQTCHGNIAELEQPSPLADAYVSVSEEVRDHLQSKGFESIVIPNGIDFNRFFPRKPVSQTLTTVLSLCQSEIANNFIRNCCEQEGLTFLSSNKYTDNIWSIEELINKSDLVVGLGRSAYDAMACGRAVLVYDYRDYMGEFLGEGMLTPENIQKSMYCNCSGRASRIHYDEHSFIKEMRKYTPELAQWSRDFALKQLNIEVAAEKYLDIYKNKREDGTYRFRLNYLLEKSRLKEENAKNEQQQLQNQLASMLQQMNDMQALYSKKGKKHLCAIRLLLWLNVVLVLLLVSLVFYMFS